MKNHYCYKAESGRSMVEMLGVLAVIGVLSVVGIYGYDIAIKKVRANEILNKANTQANDVYLQIVNGKDVLTLTNFGSNNIELKSNEAETTFKLIFSDVDGEVCEQMQDMQGTIVRRVECNGTTATLTYFKNLANNDADGAKSPTNGRTNSA